MICKEYFSYFVAGIVLLFNVMHVDAAITQETVDSASLYYSGAEYDKCIALVKEYENENCHGSEYNKQCKLKAFGAASLYAKTFTFQEVDKEDYHKMVSWGLHACEYFDRWLKIALKNCTLSEDWVDSYFNDLEIAMAAYGAISDEMVGITKRYDKMSSKWIKKTHNKFFKIRYQWSDYPFIKIKILYNNSSLKI